MKFRPWLHCIAIPKISSVLTGIGQKHAHQNKTYVNVNNAGSSLCAIDKQSWKTNMAKVPKLRTYIKYKDEYLTEIYVCCITGVKDQLWLNLNQESYHLALKEADIRIFQKSWVCASSVKKTVWKMKNTIYFIVSIHMYNCKQ